MNLLEHSKELSELCCCYCCCCCCCLTPPCSVSGQRLSAGSPLSRARGVNTCLHSPVTDHRRIYNSPLTKNFAFFIFSVTKDDKAADNSFRSIPSFNDHCHPRPWISVSAVTSITQCPPSQPPPRGRGTSQTVFSARNPIQETPLINV